MLRQIEVKKGNQSMIRSSNYWRVAQLGVFALGVVIFFCLIFFPDLGIHLFWNILIPVAPILLVFGTGLWRNICPLAFVALFPRRNGLSKRLKLSLKQTGIFNLIAVIVLLVLAPLRHAIFNLSGHATALLLLSVAIVAFVAGVFLEWKSGWCSGLCPIHPVEKMYGSNSAVKVTNAQCIDCQRCVAPCPDSVSGNNPLSSTRTAYHKAAGYIMAGAFPGFVWGWFQVPDMAWNGTVSQIVNCYQIPLLGMVASGATFFILRSVIDEKKIVPFFSAAAVSCYYWYRFPSLFGFGLFPGDGMLVDLAGRMPSWPFTLVAALLTILFFYWMVFKKGDSQSWLIRPSFAKN